MELIFTQLTDHQSAGMVIGMFVFFTLLLLIGSSQLKNRLADLDQWPVNYDNGFKEFPVMCYDNTWKIGLNTLAQEASVIMMDLRGFSEKNKGCEFEIDFILDHVSVQRILFLCKPEALNLVRRTIWNVGNCWRRPLLTIRYKHRKLRCLFQRKKTIRNCNTLWTCF